MDWQYNRNLFVIHLQGMRSFKLFCLTHLNSSPVYSQDARRMRCCRCRVVPQDGASVL